MDGDSNDETNFPNKLLLANIQFSRLRKNFVNGSPANITFWKTQLSKMIQSGGFLADLFVVIPQVMFQAGVVALKKATPKLAEKVTEYYLDKEINELKNITSSKVSEIVLTINEIKDII